MVPFQCCTIVPPRSEPTAQASLAEVAATPTNWLNWPGAGLDACVQAVPFQCRITICGVTECRKQKAVQPTAQASFAETAVTPNSAPLVVLIPVAMPGKLRYQLLHNHLDLVLTRALRHCPDVIVARVPMALDIGETPGH
jgi:hypothetical protein